MTTPTPAIDMWAPLLPVREMTDHIADHWPEAQNGYLRVFYKQAPSADIFPALARGFTQPDEAVLADLDAAGIAKALVSGFDEGTNNRDQILMKNDLVAAVAEKFPGRILPFAGADIYKGMAAVRDVEYWVRERGFCGLSLRPFMIDLPADDRRYYPFYAKCVELDIPCSIHASANWTTGRPSDLGHPHHFDVVACDFPELKLILSHAGYPWVHEACLLAWKHENVYLELGAHRPRYFAQPGAGWEPLMHFGQSTIQDKVLFGSGGFLIGRPFADLLAEFRALPLKPGILEKWLYANAAALLKLEAAAAPA